MFGHQEAIRASTSVKVFLATSGEAQGAEVRQELNLQDLAANTERIKTGRVYFCPSNRPLGDGDLPVAGEHYLELLAAVKNDSNGFCLNPFKGFGISSYLRLRRTTRHILTAALMNEVTGPLGKQQEKALTAAIDKITSFCGGDNRWARSLVVLMAGKVLARENLVSWLNRGEPLITASHELAPGVALEFLPAKSKSRRVGDVLEMLQRVTTERVVEARELAVLQVVDAQRHGGPPLQAPGAADPEVEAAVQAIMANRRAAEAFCAEVRSDGRLSTRLEALERLRPQIRLEALIDLMHGGEHALADEERMVGISLFAQLPVDYLQRGIREIIALLREEQKAKIVAVLTDALGLLTNKAQQFCQEDAAKIGLAGLIDCAKTRLARQEGPVPAYVFLQVLDALGWANELVKYIPLPDSWHLRQEIERTYAELLGRITGERAEDLEAIKSVTLYVNELAGVFFAANPAKKMVDRAMRVALPLLRVVANQRVAVSGAAEPDFAPEYRKGCFMYLHSLARITLYRSDPLYDVAEGGLPPPSQVMLMAQNRLPDAPPVAQPINDPRAVLITKEKIAALQDMLAHYSAAESSHLTVVLTNNDLPLVVKVRLASDFLSRQMYRSLATEGQVAAQLVHACLELTDYLFALTGGDVKRRLIEEFSGQLTGITSQSLRQELGSYLRRWWENLIWDPEAGEMINRLADLGAAGELTPGERQSFRETLINDAQLLLVLWPEGFSAALRTWYRSGYPPDIRRELTAAKGLLVEKIRPLTESPDGEIRAAAEAFLAR